MPRGFDQPTSSSTSRATNTGPRKQSQQPPSIKTRQGRFEAPVTIPEAKEAKQPHAISRRNSGNPSALPLPQSSSEPQPSSAGRKTPAYLQGRNPYGQVLDRVEPHREPNAVTTTAVPPSQAGSDIDSRSRMPFPSDFKTRSLAREPERCDPQTAPPSSRQSQVPKSVRSAKNFFETRASHYTSLALLPPPTTDTSTRSFAPKIRPRSVSHEPPAHVPSPKVSYTPEETTPELGQLLPFLTNLDDTSESVQSVIPFKQGAPDECARTITTGKATPAEIPDDEEQCEHDTERESIGRQRSTDIFAAITRHAKPSSINLQTARVRSVQESIPNWPLVAMGEPGSVDKSDPASEDVRHLFTRSSVPAAETKEAKNSNIHSQQEGRGAKSGRVLRRTFEEDQETSPKRLRRSGSHTAPLIESGSPSNGPVDRVAEWIPSTGATVPRHQFGKSVSVRRRAEEIVSMGLGHDGASDLSLSRRSTILSSILTANIGVEERYHEIEVPNDVDNRQGYGRRVTQDFGFPGARIKSNGTTRTSKPLRDPGNWAKRACGHFSYMGKSEHRDHAQKKICRQCSSRAPPPEELPTTQRLIRRRAISGSLTSTTSSSKPSNNDVGRRHRRRNHHSEYIPYDKCGDKFAEELSYIIGNILEEHANTLQSVISNIKKSRPNFDQLRRMSGDLVQRCQANGACGQHYQASCRPAQISCRRDNDWLTPCPYVPPNAAEKLNVGSPGQLQPNLNDPHSSLREALQSIPDLVDLVNSAADDLGVDLERRPTATDDDMFRNAPYESMYGICLV